MYGASFELKAALDYDFEMERNFKYKGLSTDEIIKHITFFVSRLWQIHAFGEGNTRTIAVFTIKYLRSMGYKVDNDIFAENSWYFRNALVRANYKNLKEGIEENPVYLERFFRNLILGENNELKNRYTHIDYDEYIKKFGENDKSSEKKFGDNQKSSEIILELLKENPKLSAKKLSEKIGITSRAVEKQLASLVEKGFIKREGSPKGGHWEILK